VVVQNGLAIDYTLSVKVCIQTGSLPSSHNLQLVCMSSTDSDELFPNSTSLTKYFLYPHPGPWFIGFQADCYNATAGYANISLWSSCSVSENNSNNIYRKVCYR